MTVLVRLVISLLAYLLANPLVNHFASPLVSPLVSCIVSLLNSAARYICTDYIQWLSRARTRSLTTSLPISFKVIVAVLYILTLRGELLMGASREVHM